MLKEDAVEVGAKLLCACADDDGLLCLVKECVEIFACVVAEKLLQGDDADFRSVKKDMLHSLRNMSIQKCKDIRPL